MKNVGLFDPLLSPQAWFAAQPEAWFDADLTSIYTAPADLTADRLPAGLFAGGGANGSLVNAAGDVVPASAGLPRFDHFISGAYSAGTSALLIEPAATNYLKSSSDSANWTLNGMTASSASGAPDGGNWLRLTTAASPQRIYQLSVVSAGTWTLSFYAKQATGQFIFTRFEGGGNWGQCFNLDTGAITVGRADGATAILAATSSHAVWDSAHNAWRFDCTVTTTSSANVFLYFSDTAASTSISAAGVVFDVWGIQCEQGSIPTSLIQTTSAAVTRPAEQIVFVLDSARSIQLTFDDGSTQTLAGSAGTNTITAASLDRTRIKTVDVAAGALAVALATETGAARALGVARPVGLATEGGTALALAAVHIRPVGLASGAESALSLTGKHIRAAGLAIETNTALALGSAAQGAVGLATETGTALALGGVQIRATGMAVGVESGLPRGSARPAGLASETGSALALAAVVIKGVGLAQESGTALALFAAQTGAVQAANETCEALALRPAGLRAPTHSRPGLEPASSRVRQVATGTRTNTAGEARPAATGRGSRPAARSTGRR